MSTDSPAAAPLATKDLVHQHVVFRDRSGNDHEGKVYIAGDETVSLFLCGKDGHPTGVKLIIDAAQIVCVVAREIKQS